MSFIFNSTVLIHLSCKPIITILPSVDVNIMLWRSSCTTSVTRVVEVTECRAGLLAGWQERRPKFWAGARNFIFSRASILTGVHWASYLMGAGWSFSSDRPVGAWSWPHIVLSCSSIPSYMFVTWLWRSFLVYQISLHYFTMIFVTVLLFLS